MDQPNTLGTGGIETLTAKSNIEVRKIDFDTLLLDGFKLFDQHCVEVEGRMFEPDLPRYAYLESKGMMLTLGAYCDNQMVGYSTCLFYRHGHHNTLMAVNDSLYVIPNFGKGVGMLLIRQTEKHTKKFGVDCMLWSAKPGSVLDLILSARRICNHETNNYRVDFNHHG